MLYTETNEWLDDETSPHRFGITKKAQNELGEIVYVDLPTIGKSLKKGELIAVLESTKAAIDLYSPMDGTIREVNSKLLENPHLLNQDPEGEGWIAAIEKSK